MLWNFETLRGYTLYATDGDIGSVRDLLFEDGGWTVRYLVVDTGPWLFGRKVLVVPAALRRPDPDRRAIPVTLCKEQIEISPDVDTDKPVSRQLEEKLHGYYGWVPYWPSEGVPPSAATAFAGGIGAAIPVLPTVPEPERRGSIEPDPHLRSAREAEGYHIQASDGAIGHIETLLIEIPDTPANAGRDIWRVRYVVIDTHNWLPGRKVLLPADWINTIDWMGRQVMVDVSRDQVRNAPSYDALAPVERSDEDRLYQYYGREP